MVMEEVERWRMMFCEVAGMEWEWHLPIDVLRDRQVYLFIWVRTIYYTCDVMQMQLLYCTLVVLSIMCPRVQACTALHISTPFSTVSLQQRGPANQCFHVHFPLRKGNSMCPFTWHILQCMFSFLSHSPLFPIQNKRRITYLYLKGKTKEELGICFSIMT